MTRSRFTRSCTGLCRVRPCTPHLDDIEALNLRAAGPDAEVTKVSINAYGHGLRERYVLLRAGGAAGFGVGPIIVSKSAREVGGRIAIPGERTTAALLLRQLGRFDTVVMRFDQIEDAVLRGDADCGVLIHEGRFTFDSKGLTLLADLGAVWEERMRCPLPLAAIAIRRDLAHLAPESTRPSRQASSTPLRIRMRAGSMSPPMHRKWILTSPGSTSSCM